MNKSFYTTFVSPYYAFSYHSSRYRKVVPVCLVILMVLPLLFLIFRTFSVYLIAQVIVFVLFPVFLWIDLNTELVTDAKLDIIKVIVVVNSYAAYLLFLAWIMLGVFKPEFRIEYMLINIGYIFLLLISSFAVAAASLYHRYAQAIRKNNQKA